MAPAASTTPPLPSFSNVVAACSVNNFNNAGYPAGQAVGIEGSDGGVNVNFTGASPYPIDYASIDPGSLPPYALGTWNDQSAFDNDLIQASSARPILDTVNKLVSFDGATSCMVGSQNLFDFDTTATATFYVLFKAGSLIETSVLLNLGTAPLTNDGGLSVRLVAGVLTASMSGASPTFLKNTKIKTISDNNWHLAAITIDTNAAAASQVLLKVDNSATGVTAPVSTDLLGVGIGKGEENNVPYVGASNQASTFFTGSMREIYGRSTVDDATAQTTMWTYVQYLQSTLP